MTPALRLLLLGSTLNPATLFSNGEAGVWLKPSDISTLFQDSAGTTPVTASGQPVGLMLDKRLVAPHNASQSTSAARLTLQSGPFAARFDGIDDGLSTGTFSAGTLTSNMDCFIAMKRNSTAQMVTTSNGPAAAVGYFGVIQSGQTLSGSADSSVGSSVSYFVDGVQVGGVGTASRDQLNTAIGSGAWKLLEVRNLNLSAWTQLTLGSYTGFMLGADMAELILCPAQTDPMRGRIRRYMGQPVGLAL